MSFPQFAEISNLSVLAQEFNMSLEYNGWYLIKE
jgi:hypothetical protein